MSCWRQPSPRRKGGSLPTHLRWNGTGVETRGLWAIFNHWMDLMVAVIHLSAVVNIRSPYSENCRTQRNSQTIGAHCAVLQRRGSRRAGNGPAEVEQTIIGIIQLRKLSRRQHPDP